MRTSSGRLSRLTSLARATRRSRPQRGVATVSPARPDSSAEFSRAGRLADSLHVLSASAHVEYMGSIRLDSNVVLTTGQYLEACRKAIAESRHEAARSLPMILGAVVVLAIGTRGVLGHGSALTPPVVSAGIQVIGLLWLLVAWIELGRCLRDVSDLRMRVTSIEALGEWEIVSRTQLVGRVLRHRWFARPARVHLAIDELIGAGVFERNGLGHLCFPVVGLAHFMPPGATLNVKRTGVA